MQKHSNKTTKRERYITYAKSPEMVDAAQERVLRAMHELLHNPETPQNLFEAVAEFVCEQSNRGGNDEIFHSGPVLNELLKSVPPEDRRGAIIAVREPKGAQLTA